MARSLTHFQVIYLDDLTIANDDLPSLKEIEVEGESKMFNFYISEIDFLGERFQYIYDDEIVPLLSHTRGLAFFLEIWEDGEDTRILKVKDGEVSYLDLVSWIKENLVF